MKKRNTWRINLAKHKYANLVTHHFLFFTGPWMQRWTIMWESHEITYSELVMCDHLLWEPSCTDNISAKPITHERCQVQLPFQTRATQSTSRGRPSWETERTAREGLTSFPEFRQQKANTKWIVVSEPMEQWCILLINSNHLAAM